MKHIKILSDYSAGSHPNLLHVMHDDQGDVHVWTTICDEYDGSIRIATSGTRHSPEVRIAFYNLIKSTRKN
jgi:hypothetical protein